MAGGVFAGAVPVVEIIHGLPPAPTCSIAPIDPSVITGATINFVATATAYKDGINYQWLLDGADIAGAVAATYDRVSDIADNGKVISCRVSDNHTQTVISNTSTMAVALPAVPTITIAPIDPSVTEGDVIAFTATASGTGTLTYQWKVNGAEVGGATAAAYNHTALLTENGYGVECVVTDGHGQVSVSAASFMTVVADIPPNNYWNQPAPQVDVAGFTASGGVLSLVSGVVRWSDGGPTSYNVRRSISTVPPNTNVLLTISTGPMAGNLDIRLDTISTGLVLLPNTDNQEFVINVGAVPGFFRFYGLGVTGNYDFIKSVFLGDAP